ncbi:MAG: putative proteasome-type protease [Paracoccaceae bacterium]
MRRQLEEEPMTYCVALKLDEGLVCLSDTRTNAGLDNISKYRKMHTWSVPGERIIVMMTAGNLAVTQAVVSSIQEAIDHPADGRETIFTAPTMFRVAEVVGSEMRSIYNQHASMLGSAADSTIILAGQRAGGPLRLFMVYSAGNFIEASESHPFLQIGEHKYGKPILDRVIRPETHLNDAVTAALLSMDSTLRSNLSVGMPIDLAVIRRDAYEFEPLVRIEEEDEAFRELSNAWSEALRESFVKMGEIVPSAWRAEDPAVETPMAPMTNALV